MERLRREAEEAKAAKEREKKERLERLGANSAISSSDYFGEGQQGGGAKSSRDYSDRLDGYTGDKPLAHAILHKVGEGVC
eukprot:2258354-Rhodomonas_salina.1